MRVQLVPRHGHHVKVRLLEQRLQETCPLPIEVVKEPLHSPEVLLLMYGAGSAERTALLQQHRQVGGRVLCFDRGYFGRSSNPEQEHYRAAIDRLHVSTEHLQATPEDPSRLARFKISLREDAQKEGPVIVAGLGQKSCSGLGILDWDRRTLEAVQRRFPKRKVIYRPKSRRPGRLFGSARWKFVDRVNPIEDVLRGASLAVVRHSNVAVDACIAGIPVECEDGAARWLYESGSKQSSERRLSFLHRVAWWNWRTDELAAAWKFLLPRLM